MWEICWVRLMVLLRWWVVMRTAIGWSVLLYGYLVEMEKTNIIFLWKNLRCQNCEWHEFFQKFPYFSRCLGFFFFRNLDVDLVAAIPLSSNVWCLWEGRGMKGREWGISHLQSPPRFALNSPVSFARRTLMAAPSSNIWHIISTIGWLQALQNLHTVVYWGYWVGCLTGGCPLWQVGSLRCFSFWWLVSWRCWRWVLPSAVSWCDSDGIDMQNQWKNTCLMLRCLHLCRYDAGQTEKHIEDIVRWVVKSYLSYLSCVVLMFYFFPNDLNWCVRTLLCVAFGFAPFGLLLPQWIQQWQPWKVCPRYPYCVGRRMLWSSMRSWAWQVV